MDKITNTQETALRHKCQTNTNMNDSTMAAYRSSVPMIWMNAVFA